MPHFNNIKQNKKQYPRCLREQFSRLMPESALELLDRMLSLDPSKRISASDALSCDWLRTVEPDKYVEHTFVETHANHPGEEAYDLTFFTNFYRSTFKNGRNYSFFIRIKKELAKKCF